MFTLISFKFKFVILKCDNLNYPDINIDIKKGEFVFLVGSSGAGKSTFIKQLKIISNGGFNETERISYTFSICVNTVNAMKTLVEQASTLNYEVKYKPISIKKITVILTHFVTHLCKFCLIDMTCLHTLNF